MIGYPITYGDELTPEEAGKRLKELQMGAMFAITCYLLVTQAANAADVPPSLPGKPPVSPPGNSPVPPPGIAPGQAVVAPAPPPNQSTKDFLGGLASTFCATAITSGSFWMGVMCGLIVIGGMKLTTPGN